MSALVICRFGEFAGLRAEVGDEATVGRDAENTVVLDSPLVSKRHARITRSADGGYLLEDLGSTNGTWLDGLPVQGRERLSRLSVLSFGGGCDVIFQDLEAAGPPAARPRREVAAPPSSPVPPRVDAGSALPGPDRTISDLDAPVVPGFLGAPLEPATDRTEHDAALPLPPGLGSFVVAPPTPPAPPPPAAAKEPPVLEVEIGSGPAQRYALRPGRYVLGREEGCTICLDSEHLSRRHAEIRVADDRLFVRDLGSTNGTMVDGVKITDEVELGAGSLLSLGNVRARWSLEDGTRSGSTESDE